MFSDLSHCFLNCVLMTTKDLWLRKFWEMLPSAPWRPTGHIHNSKGSEKSCSKFKKKTTTKMYLTLITPHISSSDDELLFSQRNTNFQNSRFRGHEVVLVWTRGPGCPCEGGIPLGQDRGPSQGWMCCVPPPLPVYAYAVSLLTPVNKSV